jgi:hypothetical protein
MAFNSENSIFPIILLLGISIAQIVIGSQNVSTWWGKAMLSFGLMVLISSLIMSWMIFGPKSSKKSK